MTIKDANGAGYSSHFFRFVVYLSVCVLFMTASCLATSALADPIAVYGGGGGGGGGGGEGEGGYEPGEGGAGGAGGTQEYDGKAGGRGDYWYDSYGGGGGGGGGGTSSEGGRAYDDQGGAAGDGGNATPGEDGDTDHGGRGGNGSSGISNEEHSDATTADFISVIAGGGGVGGSDGLASDAGTGGAGGAGGGATLTLTSGTVTTGAISVIAGAGGDGGGGIEGGAGGAGGGATLTLTSGRITSTGTVLVQSGVNGSEGGPMKGGGGAASLTANTLSAPSIILLRMGGGVSFTVTNLEIGSDFDTTLTSSGLHDGDASITNLLLTGDKNFILTSTGVSVGQLNIDGGTLNDTNWTNLVDSGITYSATNDITLLEDGVTVDLGMGEDKVLDRVLTGSGGLTKTGAGILTLSGANTYSGGTTINQGLISFTSGGLGTGQITLDGGGLQWAGGNTVDISSRLTALGTGGGVFDTNGEHVTFAAALTGDGGLTKTGAGTLTLNGENTYSGNTTVTAGTLEVTGLLGNGSYGGDIANAGTLLFNQSADQALSGVISGEGGLTKAGAGTLTLNGENTYSGNTTVTAGTLEVAGLLGNGSYGGDIANTGTLLFNQSAAQTLSGVISGDGGLTKAGAGTLTLSGENTYSGDTTVMAGTLEVTGLLGNGSYGGNIANDGTLLFNQSADQALSGVISGHGGLTKTGTGILILSGANIYSGDTTINQGLISFTSDGLGTGQITLDGGGLQWAGGNTEDISSRLTALGAGGGVFDTNGENVTFASALTGDGGLTKAGAGTLTLNGENIYSGDTTVTAGTLEVTGLLGNGSYGGDIANAGTLLFNQSADQALSGVISGHGGLTKTGTGILTLSGANTYSGDTTVTAGTLEVTGALGNGSYGGKIANDGTLLFNQSADQALSGVISGHGGLTKTGTGILILSGANTYSGDTTINQGLISFTSGGLGAGQITLDGGGLQWSGGNTEDISSRLTPLGAGGGVFDTNGEDVTFASALTGDGGLTKAGAGTLTLSGENTYSGDTTVTAGTLEVTGLLGNGSYGGDIANAGTLLFDQSAGQTLSGVISGDGGLTKTGTGILTLSGANTYSGDTTINQGLISFTSGGLGTGQITLDGGGLQWSGGNTEDISSRLTALGAGGGVFDTNGEDVAFASALTGDGGLTKAGTGTLILSGENTYSGDTTVTAGTLEVTGALGNGSYDGDIANAGTLLFNQSAGQALSGVISGDGGLTKAGTGTLTLSGENTYSGDTTVMAGTLEVTGLLGNGSYDGDIANAGTLLFNQSADQTLSGVISGDGGLTKTGTGILTLSGANSFFGPLTVSAGALYLSGTGQLMQASALSLGAGAIFDYSAASAYGAASPLALKNTTVNGLGARINPNPGHVADFSAGSLYFNIPNTAVANDILLTVNGDADITGADIGLDTPSGRPDLSIGQQVTLLDVTGTLDSDITTLTVQTTNGDTYAIQVTGNQLLAMLQSLSSTTPAYARLKAYAESRAANLAFINQGADLILNQGFGSALAATSGEGFRFGAFGGMGGGWSRYNTGSHVDVFGASLLAGVALGNDVGPGRAALGVFFEGGWGSYTSHNSFSNYASAKGEGDTSYMGGGVLGRYDLTSGALSGLYVDASARLGRARADFNSGDITYNGKSADFDAASMYYGLHGGLGYVWSINETARLDLSAKFLWTRQEGDSVSVHGDCVRFKDADSSRSRLGGRFAYAVNEYVVPYAGAYWEHEFDGKARGTVNGTSIDAPSLKGDTGMGEIGLTLKPSPNLPLSFDLGVQGHTGVREGITGSLQVKWEF